jgi:hypothetical protein
VKQNRKNLLYVTSAGAAAKRSASRKSQLQEAQNHLCGIVDKLFTNVIRMLSINQLVVV